MYHQPLLPDIIGVGVTKVQLEDAPHDIEP